MSERTNQLSYSDESALLRAIFRGGDIGICAVDESGQFVLVNPAYCAIYGYTREELLGTHFSVLMPADAREQATQLHRDFLAEGGNRDGEWDVLTRSGERLRIKLHSECVNLPDGRRFRASTVLDVSAMRRTEDELRALSDVIAQTSHGVIFTDAEGRVTWINESTERMTGFTVAEMRGQKPGDLLQGVGSDPDVVAHMSQQIKAGEGFQVELLNYTKAGQPFHLHISCSPVRDGGGRLTGFMALQTDTTEGQVVRERLDQAAHDIKRLRIAVEQSPASIVITTVEGDIEYVNQTCLDETGYTRAELIGRNPRIFQSGATPRAMYVDLWATISAGHTWHGRMRNRRKDGSEYLESISISPVLDRDGRATSYIAVKENITEREEMARHLDAMARFDAMTGLANRAAFFEELETRLEQLGHRQVSQLLALVNIDRFHAVNDMHGHNVGDLLLQSVARRLTRLVPAHSLVARIGPDHFAVLLPLRDVRQEQSLLGDEPSPLLRIQQACSTRFRVEAITLDVSVSIGVAACDHLGTFPGARVQPGQLLRMAESALEAARAQGGGRLVFFDRDASSRAQEIIRLEQDLSMALQRNELRLVLQAQVDTAGRLTGAEALLRWQHRSLGEIPPARFIPLAEENGQIIPIGYWIFQQALLLLEQLQAIDPALTLSVNVSPVQVRDGQFLARVAQLLKASQAAASGLIIEITERVFMSDPELAEERLHGLRALGPGISIDDFGTGYSSLSYLKRLPVTELKIDKSFIADLPHDEADLALVQIIISAARVRAMRVVAEGVETEEQAVCLRNMHGLLIQGYLYDRPTEPGQWLHKWGGKPQAARR